MQNAGTALVGIGIGSGQDRAIAAVTQAVNSPLLETSIEGAKGVSLRDFRSKEAHERSQRYR